MPQPIQSKPLWDRDPIDTPDLQACPPGYVHGWNDVMNSGVRPISRLELATMQDQRYAEDYREGVKKARKAKMTAAQKRMIVMHAKNYNAAKDPMGSYPLA